MLAQRYRFHGHGSLRYLYRNGKIIRTPDLTLRYIQNSNRVHSRYTVIVSKKVLKSAVKRNRIRRRIYEIIRKENIQVQPSFDIAISVFSADLLEVSHDELRKKITSLFKKANIL
ncbi:ribonuclease P protein component [Candidatus Saccharibacteria bacterium]|nr:ribonuclease P protein component [Candidatus Saccharibacteria bacterium]